MIYDEMTFLLNREEEKSKKSGECKFFFHQKCKLRINF